MSFTNTLRPSLFSNTLKPSLVSKYLINYDVFRHDPSSLAWGGKKTSLHLSPALMDVTVRCGVHAGVYERVG
jgi:hypothetical protein